MYRKRNRLLLFMLCIFLLCSSAQATILLISVQDSADNSTIPQATVFVNGENYGRTNNYGLVFLNHSGVNDQRIRISMSGYDDWEKLVAKNETSVLINLSRKSVSLKINLYDSDSLGSVPGALVNVSSENMKQMNLTDVSGAVTFGVNAITLYSVHITAPGYLPRSSIIDMGSEDKDAQYWLSNTSRFTFFIKDKLGMTPVPDAEVLIDNALAGRTDSRGILTIPVKRGKMYTISIKKEGYQTISETRILSDTDSLSSVTLVKEPVGAFITVFDENRIPINGTDVYINGIFSGITNQYGRINFPSLVAGTYNIEVKKSGYITANRTIAVITKSEDYTFELPYENADLTLFVQEKNQKIIPGATIIINGNETGITDDHGLFRTKVRFNTPYNITAVKDTYQTVSVQERFAQGNATPSVTLIMEKSLDLGVIAIVVIGLLGVIIAFVTLRKRGSRKPQQSVKKNEL
jgi:hypothetical protein